MAQVLKLDGRTARGRYWKELNSCGKPINQGILISGKMCSCCNQSPDIEKQTIKCMKCNAHFHITCLLKPMTEDHVKDIAENPCMWWFCLNCMSVKSSDMSNQNIDTGVIPTDVLLQTNLATFKKDMLNLISETIDRKFKESADAAASKDNGIPCTVNNKNTNSPLNAWENKHGLASTFKSGNPTLINDTGKITPPKSNKPDAKKHVLLLDPIQPEVVNAENFNKATVQNVNKAINGINVDFCKVRKSGVVAIGFADASSKQKAQDEIEKRPEISDVFTVKSPKQLLPKVSLLGINGVLFDACNGKDEMKSVLLKDILARNYDIKCLVDSSPEEILEVVMIQKFMPYANVVEYSAVLKMSSAIRKLIHNKGNRLYVSLSRCRIINKYQFLQCYHCQKPGHHSDNCPDKNNDPTCMYCSEKHKSKLCTQKKDKKCCSNCLNSNKASLKANACTHNAASMDCPMLKSLCEGIKNNTENWLEKK